MMFRVLHDGATHESETVVNVWHSHTSQKSFVGDEVLPEFRDICLNHDFLVQVEPP